MRAQAKRAMTVAHKLEMVRRNRVKRKLREQEDRKRHLEDLKEKIRKEEEECARARQWWAAERKARKDAALAEEDARKAACAAAQWVLFAAEEGEQQERAKLARQEYEAQHTRAAQHEKLIADARIAEQQRHDRLLAPRRQSNRSPTARNANAQAGAFGSLAQLSSAPAKLFPASLLRVRTSLQWLHTPRQRVSPMAVIIERAENGLPKRPPVGLIPWEPRFDVHAHAHTKCDSTPSARRSHSVLSMREKEAARARETLAMGHALPKNAMPHSAMSHSALPHSAVRCHSEMRGKYAAPAREKGHAQKLGAAIVSTLAGASQRHARTRNSQHITHAHHSTHCNTHCNTLHPHVASRAQNNVPRVRLAWQPLVRVMWSSVWSSVWCSMCCSSSYTHTHTHTHTHHW